MSQPRSSRNGVGGKPRPPCSAEPPGDRKVLTRLVRTRKSPQIPTISRTRHEGSCSADSTVAHLARTHVATGTAVVRVTEHVDRLFASIAWNAIDITIIFHTGIDNAVSCHTSHISIRCITRMIARAAVLERIRRATRRSLLGRRIGRRGRIEWSPRLALCMAGITVLIRRRPFENQRCLPDRR